MSWRSTSYRFPCLMASKKLRLIYCLIRSLTKLGANLVRDGRESFARLRVCYSCNDRFPIFVKQVAIDGDLRLGHVTQHIPVQARFIPAAALWETHPDGKVDRASELFIEEHVFAKALDPIIGADAPFTEDTSAGVRVQQRGEQLLVFRRLFFDNLAILKPKLDIGHFLTIIDGRVFESDPAIDRILERAGENFAIREIVAPIGDLKDTIFARK